MSKRRIKWGYATHVLPNAAPTLDVLDGALQASQDPPRANDVIVAEVMEIGRHSKIELPFKRACTLFPGDLVGVAYGHRYATRQFEGTVPKGNDVCHMLTVGGVCGEVVGMPTDMEPPTLLRQLGYLREADGSRVNLESYGLGVLGQSFGGAKVIVVVGSAMDSGKTTAAYSIVHGLTRSGATVCAAKLTGTASAKDPLIMEDAGAVRVYDFTDLGHASTALCSREQLWKIVVAIRSNLAAMSPDYIVLEIADGVVQRETRMLLELFQEHRVVDHFVYTCNDSLGVAAGIGTLQAYGFHVAAVSGWVGCSPLAAREAQEQTDLPVVRPEQLREPAVVSLFEDRTMKERSASMRAVGVPGRMSAPAPSLENAA